MRCGTVPALKDGMIKKISIKVEFMMKNVTQRFISECQKNSNIEMSDEDIQSEVDAVRIKEMN